MHDRDSLSKERPDAFATDSSEINSPDEGDIIVAPIIFLDFLS